MIIIVYTPAANTWAIVELEGIAIYNNCVCTCTVATVCSESMTVRFEGEKQLLLQHHLPNARPISG